VAEGGFFPHSGVLTYDDIREPEKKVKDIHVSRAACAGNGAEQIDGWKKRDRGRFRLRKEKMQSWGEGGKPGVSEETHEWGGGAKDRQKSIKCDKPSKGVSHYDRLGLAAQESRGKAQGRSKGSARGD